jgi:hypothetical protein
VVKFERRTGGTDIVTKEPDELVGKIFWRREDFTVKGFLLEFLGV